MIIVNKTCPACGSMHIGRIGNYLTNTMCIILCYDCGHKVTAFAESAPGKSVQQEIMEAEQKAAELWNGADAYAAGRRSPRGGRYAKNAR